MKVFVFGIVCFVIGFFVGGKWKQHVMRKVFQTAETFNDKVNAIHKELGKWL